MFNSLHLDLFSSVTLDQFLGLPYRGNVAFFKTFTKQRIQHFNLMQSSKQLQRLAKEQF